jgi:hypothetical protein
MHLKNIILVFILLCYISVNNTDTILPEPETYFKGDFDGVKVVNNQLKGAKWTDMINNPLNQQFKFNNLGSSAYAFQDIRSDPINPNNQVLYAQVTGDDPAMGGTTRAQVSWYWNNGVDLDVAHVSYRVLWNKDLAELEQYPDEITWFTIMELWERRDPNLTGDPAGHARWNIGFYKDAGVGSKLYWALTGQYMQPKEIAQTNIWPVQKNKTVGLYLGQWLTFDLYFKRGQGNDGHILISIQPDGGVKQTVFDKHVATEYPNNPTPWYAWNIWKLYTSPARLNWMKARGKSISAYYDDFKWFKK